MMLFNSRQQMSYFRDRAPRQRLGFEFVPHRTGSISNERFADGKG